MSATSAKVRRPAAANAPAATPAIKPVFSCDIFARQRVGGVSRYFAQLHRELVKLGVEPAIIAPLYVSNYVQDEPGVGGRRLPSVLDIRGSTRLTRGLGHAVQTPRLRRLTRAHPGVVFHPTYYTAPFPPTGIAVAVTVYDMIHERHPEWFDGSAGLSARKREWIARADVLLAISEHTKQELREVLDVAPERIAVTPLAPTTVAPDPRTAARLERVDFFLFVGQRGGYKNFDRLVSAFARSRARAEGFSLVAFGGGPPTRAELRRVEAAGLRDRVAFRTGDDAVLAAHYSRARALVYPSLAEGFGLPPLEAMSHGCPVAAGRTPAVVETVGDAAQLFDPTDSDELVAALDTLTNDEGVRTRLQGAGRARAAQFTWTETARATLAAYGSALSARESAA